MTINKIKNGNKITIAVAGRIDTNTAPQLEKAVDEVINDAKILIFDFKELAYISSVGLRVLLSAQKTMNKQGSMKVINVNESIMEIMEITGFTDILTIKK
ncbi:MAG: STAS domain-containing protein [Clostridia bacterium]|jgi:anti-sigma B factor antagonist|nr:STAS domain-containing protein [Clostridia bacterium]